MKFYIVTILFGLCAVPVFSQNSIVSPGACPTVKTLNFKETEYAGTWYEIKRFENTLITRPCGEANYNYDKQNKGYNLKYVTRDTEKKINLTENWRIKPVDPKTPDGRYTIIKNGTSADLIAHQILDTDYKNYSIVWGCYLDETNKNIQRLFIYSRKTNLTESNLKSINTTLDTYKINRTALIDVDQSAKLCGRSTGVSLSVPAMFFFILLSVISKTI